MYYVYLLRSLARPDKKYIGFTTNLNRRFHEHNCGKSPYTARFVPWEIVAFVCFKDEEKARRFEKYLKSGSGHAFAKRHFWE